MMMMMMVVVVVVVGEAVAGKQTCILVAR